MSKRGATPVPLSLANKFSELRTDRRSVGHFASLNLLQKLPVRPQCHRL